MLRVCWNWLVHDAAPSGANRRRQELLAALLRDSTESALSRVVVALGRDARCDANDPRLVTVRPGLRRGAASRFLYESSAISALVREHGCHVLFQESFPVPRIDGIPIVLTVHDLRDLSPLGRGSGPARRAVAPLAIRHGLRRARAVVAVSEFTRAELIHYGSVSHGKITVIPNAADHLRATARRSAARPRTILHVGHLETRKGADLLLEAFALLPRGDRDRLHYCGRGRLERRLRARAEALGVGDRVTFGAAESDAELLDLYRRATLLAVPSRYEGFGIPLLEGMQLGVPVVAMDRGALAEVAGGAARLVASDAPAAWRDALAEVLESPTLQKRLASLGRARAEHYSWRASARGLLELALSVTARP
jgi:glycosyltransferase involved in cell wall biosynthesis